MRRLREALAMTLLLAGIVFMAILIPKTIDATKEAATNTLTTEPTTIPLGSKSGSSPSSSGSSSNQSTNKATTATQTNDLTANWAGYASTGGNYTSVSASWQVPEVGASDQTASDATWIGIGGVNSSDLIQVGTQDVVEDGQVQSSAFYETLPEASQDISSVPINPGDSISASLTETAPDVWQISIVDNTTTQSYQTSVDYYSSNSSAEWIEEDPSDGYSFLPLDDFGSLTLTGATTTDNGTLDNLLSSGATPAVMVNDADQIVANVSTVSSNGSSFTITRTSVPSEEDNPGFNRLPGGYINSGFGSGGFAFSFGF